MYSLILTDEVIDRIDRLAYERGISRSQLIDHILADTVGLSTPEQQRRALVKKAADHISLRESGLQLHVRNDYQGMEATTFVKYKYNPTIKYNVEVVQGADGLEGVLKISSRSTSSDLRQHLDEFLQLFNDVDHTGRQIYAVKEQEEENPRSGGARFARTLHLNNLFGKNEDPETAAPHLGRSLTLLDEAMQLYFSSLGQQQEDNLTDRLRELYLRTLSEEGLLE